MKRMFSALLLFVLAMGVFAAPEARGEEDAGKKLIRGLMIRGAQAVQEKLQAKQDRTDQTQDAANDTAPGANVSRGVADILKPGGLARIVREVLHDTLNALKEEYKEEGKVYVRELGDLLAARIMQNEKVQSSLFMVKMIGWFVVIYITLVTLMLVYTLRKLSLSNKRMLELLEAQEERRLAGLRG